MPTSDHRLAGLRNLVWFFALIAAICIVGKLIERARWAGPLEWQDPPPVPRVELDEGEEPDVGLWRREG